MKDSLDDFLMRNSTDSSRLCEELLPGLLLEQARRHPNDPLIWSEAYRRFDGKPMAIPPALHAIYRDTHPFVVVQKPAQVGVTEYNINMALWCAATKQGGRGNVLYLMPTQENADRLSQRRLASTFAQSPELAGLVGNVDGSGVKPAQRVQMRSVGPGVIYLSGSDQTSQFTGIDADLVVLDEYDLMNEDVLPNALPRLRSSKLGYLRVTSTPTIPEFGVNGLLARSDERHYQLECQSCGLWIDPQVPLNVDFERDLVVCDCGAALDCWGPGRWVAARPEITDIRGYQLNRLVLPKPHLREMRLAASGTIGMKVEEFWRQDLGVPFVTADARLSAADLDNCRSEEPPPVAFMKDPWLDTGPKSVVMGVDVGQDHFWVVVRLFFKKKSYPLFVGQVHGDWDALDDLCERFKVKFCAVDSQPDTRGAINFAKRRAGHPYVFLCSYDKRSGTEHDWDWSIPGTIKAIRTLSLDQTFDGFRRQRTLLPIQGRDLASGAYYEHLQALVRTTEPDDFGQPVPAYRHTRPDHLAHAENYITLVATRQGAWEGWWE